MNWEALSSIAEIIGAVAIVISLIYVGVQVKQSNALSRGNAFQHMNTHFTDVMAQLSTNAELTGIYKKVTEDGQELDPEEWIRYSSYLNSFFSFLENIEVQTNLGLFSESLESEDSTLMMLPHYSKLLRTPQAADWWKNHARYLFTPEFHQKVSRHLGIELSNS